MMDEKKRVYIRLDAPYRIKYEDTEEFDDSIFSPVYRQASQITREIVEKNKECNGYYKKKGNAFRNNEQIYNVISFVGSRGSGKSSCMLSFAEFLKDYHRIENVDKIKNYQIGKDLAFIGIDVIDAGLLEEKEDIVEVVLAKLLTEYQKLEKNGEGTRNMDFDYQKREFNRCLQNVYSSNIRRKTEREAAEFATFSVLDEMAVSVNMRESIKELIERFLELMKNRFFLKNHGDADCFVVIPIDDIDMNIKKGYEMLEQIRRYLMVPNVIVLLSYDYNQLMNICNLYYTNKMAKLRDIREEADYVALIEHLSASYMAKVVPDGRRICLPTMEETVQHSEEPVYIIPADSKYKNKDAHKPDETFLRKVDLCLKIRTQYPGSDMKLWEADDLRGMCNLYNELHVLREPDAYPDINEEDLRKLYEDNYTYLFNHIKYQAEKKLSVDDNRIFVNIVNCSLSDKNKVIYNQCRKLVPLSSMSKEGLAAKGKAPDLGTSLWIVNRLRRSKEHADLAVFIRAYLSALIGNLYFVENDFKEKNGNLISAGMSVYDGLVFPEVIYKARESDTSGYLQNIGFFKNMDEWVDISFTIKKNKIENCDLKKVEALYLFLSGTDKVFLEFAKKNGKVCITVHLKDCCFRITNFIWNVFQYKRHLGELQDKLQKTFKSALNLSPEKEAALFDDLKEQSLLTDLGQWEERYHTSQLIPFYNIDFLSYILDKCSSLAAKEKIECTGEKIETKGEEVEKTIVQKGVAAFIGRIKSALKEQDDFYRGACRETDQEPYSLAEIFRECPLIKAIEGGEIVLPLLKWMRGNRDMILHDGKEEDTL